jgi:DNA polymerase-3 subunit delta'
MRYEFPRTLGQEEAKDRLRRALASGRFPHALLVHGEPGLGQHALLLDLAQILSCEHPEARPCGACFPCKAFGASALETVQYLVPVAKGDRKGDGDDDDGPESGQLEELGESIDRWHREPYGYAAPGKALVRMSQARELVGRLRFSGTDGKARLVLVPWLESLGPEPANALLKTLEEPPAGVYLLIASDHRSALLQTLLSRCLHLGLSPLPLKEFRAAAEALAQRAGRPASPRLLPFAEGSPGAYLGLLENGGEELLEEALAFLAAARSDWRSFADYAAAIEGGAEGMEHASRLLAFLLRMLRAARALRAKHGATHADGQADGYRWTARALEAEGWDASLTPHLGAFEDIADPDAFATFLAEAHRAIREYSKPSIALTGLFLEYEAAVHARHPAETAR